MGEKRFLVGVDAVKKKRLFFSFATNAATIGSTQARDGRLGHETMAMNGMSAPTEILLGKYQVERVLGQGGMGAVMAVRHIDLGELYAMKLMLPHMLHEKDASERFLREARASARLKGDHVARVHDVGRFDDGTLFMVMEYLEGTDLKRQLETQGRFSVNEAIDYVLQACEAIAEAHELGIVHRDIKPANLFLTRKRKSGKPHIKVLDFGISKEVQPEKGNDLTKTGAMLGSPLYMSPEQMMHAREVDGRTDIWSLGVVLYELVSGRVPFEGDTFTQVVHSVTNLEPKPIRGYVPDLPSALIAVLDRCLAKDPAMRFESIDAFAKALEGAAKNEPAYDIAMADTAHAPTGSRPVQAKAANESRANGEDAVASSFLGTVQPATSSAPKTRTRPVTAVIVAMAILGGASYLALRSSTVHGARPSGADNEKKMVTTASTEPLQEALPSAPTAMAIVAPTQSTSAAANLAASAAPATTTRPSMKSAPTSTARPVETTTTTAIPTASTVPPATPLWKQGPL